MTFEEKGGMAAMVEKVPTQTAASPEGSARRAELLVLFRRVAAEILDKDFSSVGEATVISELGIDSLGMLEIIGAMEGELSVQIPDEYLSGITTIKDLIEVVERRIDEGKSAS